MSTISIVIPAHNEEGNIGTLVQEILATRLECEIIVVDDASTDETHQTLLALKRTVPSLKIVQHDRSYGQSAAVATGIRHASGELIATMDGDGQNDPADIPKMVQALMKSGDKNLRMVAGFRKKRDDAAWRIICSKIANAYRRFFLRDETPDTGCGLKVFYRSAFLNLPFFDHMHRFLPALIKMQGGEVVSVEVEHRARTHGVSKYGTLNRLWVGIVDILGVCWLRMRAKNVKITRCD
ncbi:undecaprenyl-phosphate glycosyltransferase, putative [Citrifermentans bemidjiense Bem]|uniref:Undecaprenyl-phosphate glycosyltransferase, putative n=1 Tax=Citrifermentans bemidjiense (strain ATCC BAA-1014 / DSM 16622 / JCM 12645 / Bem) TaxID=404380 RepID=B5EFA0_CITBB|nr:glycosyltransferase family 2 protein [Citrifermentans bemidjiense]ACH40855.1 undecaprenyl-phosphate glycosyltransferase, putative [Citrifermentans bemidjiense Bem]